MSIKPSSLYASDAAQAAARLVRFYEQLAPADLATLTHYYAPQASFKDPFNEVQGVVSIARIFTHMFTHLDNPRFVVTEQLVQGDQAFLVWEFRFQMKRGRRREPLCVHGGSLVRFDANGKVVQHRDYWDTAEELYAKLPGIGALFRWLRRQGSATNSV